MEEYFVVKGGKKLSGEIEVFGAKNSATPIIAATLLTKKDCYIDNIPKIKDVLAILDILKSLGSKIQWQGPRKIKISNKNINPENINQDLIGKLRSSILLIGPLLARFKKLKIAKPGGCMIGARPLDAHLEALADLGVKVRQTKNFLYLEAKKTSFLKPVVLKELSVTATENIMMFASLASKPLVLKMAAIEPQVQDLAVFLRKLGLKIDFRLDHTITIKGNKNLKGASHFIIYDPIEAGTFIALALAAKSQLTIKNVHIEFLEAVFRKIREIGAKYEVKKINSKASFNAYKVKIIPPKSLKPFKIQTLPYPGFPTDLQAPFGLVATQAEGMSLIQDPLFEGRLKYLGELSRMGAETIICDAHRAIIVGPKKLYGQKIVSYDLRAGATLVVASLIAKGESRISEVYQVDRGYEQIEKRLQKIGANIKRVKK